MKSSGSRKHIGLLVIAVLVVTAIWVGVTGGQIPGHNLIAYDYADYDDVDYVEYEDGGREMVAADQALSVTISNQTSSKLSAQSSFYNPGLGAAEVDQRVIQNGSLDLIVVDVDKAIDEVSMVAQRFEGIVVNAYSSGSEPDQRYASISIKVPAEQYFAAFDALKQIAKRVNSEQTTSNDVTLEYVDLEARLANHQARELRYLGLLDQADSVEEILEIQERIDSERIEIETLQARLLYLGQQTTYSRITATLSSEEVTDLVDNAWQPDLTAKESVRDLTDALTRFVDFLIRIVIALPVILLWLGLIGLVIFIAYRFLQFIIRLARGDKVVTKKTTKKPTKQKESLKSVLAKTQQVAEVSEEEEVRTINPRPVKKKSATKKTTKKTTKSKKD